jgi:peptide/nickel transport system permease protein
MESRATGDTPNLSLQMRQPEFSFAARLRRIFGSMQQMRAALIATFVLAVIVFCAIFAPVLAPHDPLQQNLEQRLRPPAWLEKGSWENPLGTDQLGRDILSRLIYGSRVSLIVGLTSVAIAGGIGVMLGLLAGFYGGVVDAVIMRIADIQLAFPFLLLAIAVVAVVGPGLLNVIIVLGITGWMGYARVIRGQVLSVREMEYVDAARAIGCPSLKILLRHIAPNSMTPVIVLATFAVAGTIISEASLTFLGLGVEPQIPSWGIMLSDGKDYLGGGWWISTFPGLTIMLTVLAINMLGDWARDVLDPRMQMAE